MTRPRLVQKIEDRLGDVTATPPGLEDAARAARVEPAHPNSPDDTHAVFGVGATPGQSTGAIGGATVGGLAGGLVLFAFGFIGWGGGVALGWRILTCAVIGVVAGAVAGAVYFGGRLPELRGETDAADGNLIHRHAAASTREPAPRRHAPS